ncbi:ABC transporter substrate-binding protein [Geobacter sp. 60473]|uniref:ABC transporter substrate-binding protein n=1 Tax=Geobacter sp. 60473 TaxID=3080755 RepID=UPI002B283BBB|nr:ABC transporter substrate-binding protein [Geobacter sp. 60473]
MRYCLDVILVVLLVAVSVPEAARAADYVLVVNRDNPVRTLTEQEARLMFLGKKTAWPDGRSVTIVLQDGNKAHSSFVQGVLHRSSQQYDIYWKKALFTGTAIPPRILKGDADVKAFVATTPTAVGYISPETVDGSVRVLEVRQ